MSADLEVLARGIGAALSTRSEHIVQHPAELKRLAVLSDAELRDFGRAHGWSIVRRVGGAAIKFYNDAAVR